MAIQINEGTSGKYVRTTEVSSGTHAGQTILIDATGGILGTAVNPIAVMPPAAGSLIVSGTVTATPTGTQVVSAAATFPVSGAFYQSTQPVNVVATVPVSGAFFQSTQPVNVVATVPVSGAFYQATQPISGSVSVINTPVVTATISVMPVLSATNVTIASIATGTVSVVALPAISGSVSVINTPTITVSTGTVTAIASGTQLSQLVANANRVSGYVVATTSGAIVLTSGAHTIYVTDFIVSVPTANNVQLASAATAIMAPMYLGANGGAVSNLNNPLVCNSAQSLAVLLSSSGTCGVTFVGYTVT